MRDGAASGSSRPSTLGTLLAHQRSETRERELLRVLALLRSRIRVADAVGADRAGLDRAVREFGRELHELRARRLACGR
jgi:hypothetical protein